MQNRTKFRHFLPKRGRIWHKIDVFCDRFYWNGRCPAAREPSQRAPTKNWPTARKHHRAPHTYLPVGGHRISRAGRWLVTDMVKPIKLTQRVNRHFPHPYHGFGGKPVLQTNGLFERVSAFGRFWGYQILPNFTNFYQKCVAKGGRRGSKRQLMRGFLRAIYLNRVKSGGSCQALIGAPPDPPERGGRKDGRG